MSHRPALLVAQSGELGGAERVLLDWAGAIARPVVLAAPPGALLDAARAAGLGVAPLPARPLRRRGRSAAAGRDLAGLALDVARLARRRRPAVVVASGLRPLLAAAAAPLAGAPLVAVHHDLPARAVAAAARAASRRAAAVVATSEAVARATGARGRTTVVRPGVDLAAWAAVPPPPPGPARALVLGALVPWKRADLALEVAARLPGLRLDVAGAPLPGDPPAYAAALAERAARADLAGRVRLRGATDARTALADAHVLLHCADREPFGLALVEALAAGRPVVAPAAGGPAEIVTPACGRLYAPGDAAAAATALEAVLADPPSPQRARERAAAFDRDAAAAAFAAVVARAAQAQRA